MFGNEWNDIIGKQKVWSIPNCKPKYEINSDFWLYSRVVRKDVSEKDVLSCLLPRIWEMVKGLAMGLCLGCGAWAMGTENILRST